MKMHRWVAVVGCMLAGCGQAPANDWQRIRRAEGCTSIQEPDAPREFPVRLNPTLESELITLVRYKKIDEPRCWFGRSDGALVLRSGSICASMQEAVFHQQDAVWTMAYYKEYPEAVCTWHQRS